MINVSEVAAGKINELLTEENKAGSGLRVFSHKGGGCSGLSARPDDSKKTGRGPATRCTNRTA